MATITSHGQQASQGDRPMESLISGVKEVLAQVGPARKQVAEYRTYISEMFKQNEELNKRCQELHQENKDLKQELSKTKASEANISRGGESLLKLLTGVEQAVGLVAPAKEQILLLHSTLNQKIRSLEEEKKSMQSKYDEVQRRCEYLEKQMQERGMNFTINGENMLDQTQSIINESYDEHKPGIEETTTTLCNTPDTCSTEESDGKQQLKEIGLCGDPDNIARLFRDVYDKSWMDALKGGQKFFKQHTEELIIRQILRVLNEVNDFCSKECVRQIKDAQEFHKHEVELKESIAAKRRVLNSMRSSTTDQTVGTIFEAFQKSFKDYIVAHTFAKTIPNFVRDCIRACWLMNLHEPTLSMQSNIAYGSDLDSNAFEIYNKEGNRVYYVVWPALLLHKGGPVLAKGVVECIPSHKRPTTSRQTKPFK